MASLAPVTDRPPVGGAYRVDISRGRNVDRVSSEWFSRPDDERYLSLTDLYEIDDEAARRALIDYHGVDEQELDGMALPSTMDARRPGWMIAANAEPLARLPGGLRRLLERLHLAHVALGSLPPERDAWHYDHEQACDYIPDLEECSHLPPLTLVPFEQFARELDDVARHGMETGFMDIAGLCPLPDAARIDDWLVSLRLGAAFLCAVQDLIRFDPAQS